MVEKHWTAQFCWWQKSLIPQEAIEHFAQNLKEELGEATVALDQIKWF